MTEHEIVPIVGKTGRREEIEITPAMIAAGAEVIYIRFSDIMPYGSETARDVAFEVFQAMAAIHPPPDEKR